MTTTSASAATNQTSPELANEFWGGLASMLVALPSSIAFGVLVYSAISPAMVGEGALVGMIGAAALGITAPLIGRTPALISAPCAPAAAILSGLAITLMNSGVESARIPGLLALTALMSSLLQVAYGLLKGGRLIKYIPYPVVSGYLSGVGLIIALGQLPKLLGLPKGTELFDGITSPELWVIPGIIVGIVTIVVMQLAPRLTSKVPAAILGLLAGIATYFGLGLFIPALMTVEANPLVIGTISSSASFTETVSGRFSSILQIRMEDLKLVAYSAIALSVLLSIDTLKTCVVLDALTMNRHNSNRELFGQGIANIVSFLSGGMAGAGTMGPTLVNVTSGGRSTRSGVAEGVLVILAILVLSPLIAWVPIATLAGIMLVVAYRMFDWHAFNLLKHTETRFDFAVIAAVVVVAETMGLIQASATGVGLAILLFIRDQIRGTVLRRRFSLKQTSSKTHRLEAERKLLDQFGEDAGVDDLQGNLFFGTTDQLYTELEGDLQTRKWILFDLRRVQSLDYTAAHLLTLMQDRLTKRGGGLLICGIPSSMASRQDLFRYLFRVGLVSENGTGIRVFETRDEGLEWMEDRILTSTGWKGTPEESMLDLKQIELLRGLEEVTLEELRKCMIERSYKAGEKIFAQGDEGDEIVMLRRGIVRILLPLAGGKIHHLATINQGDYFGEMAFLDKGLRSANAIARTDCDVYILSRKEFNAHSRTNPVLGAKVYARLARAVSLRLRQTVIELRSNEDR